jgi:ribosomal protein S18 acetylase RimI-like enzyme
LHTATGATIRLARQSDIASFYASCYRHLDWAQFTKRFGSSLYRQSAGKLLYLVADTEYGVIAGGKLVSYDSYLEIADLMVSPFWRGQGLGTALITLMLNIAADVNIGDIEIGVLQQNERALALYQRLGFVHDRELTMPGKPPAYILVYGRQPVYDSEPAA